MKDIQLIELDKIKIDGGTQHRKVDDKVRDEYAELIREGVDFPPVEVVYDGKHYWLWDGFHRYNAHIAAEADCIMAHITEGKKRDAIWLSFGANKDHGVRRKAKDVRGIIAKIMDDPEWNKMNDSQISDLVGITERHVRRIRSELEENVRKPDKCPVIGENDSTTDPEAKETGNVKTNVNTDSAKTTHLNSDKPALREPTKDGAGNEIPQKLVEVFLKGQILQSLSTVLSRIENKVINLCSTNPPEVRHLPFDRFKVDIENARRDLRCSRPYAVCCYCGGNGKGCKPCKGSGFLTKSMWDNAPRELK